MVHTHTQMVGYQARLEYFDELHYACGTSTDLDRCRLQSAVTNRSMVVAIKKWRVRHNDPDSDQYTKRLCGRLACWRRLRHPHIAPFMGLLLTETGPPTLVMPFFERGNIMDHLANNSSVNILSLLSEIASGLRYMHTLDPPVAHGTLKGSNILITDTGKACISDPCINMLPAPPFWTIENTVYARWLAPEILVSGTAEDDPPLASTEGDVYSFGMTAIEMYTGRRPFSHLRSRVAVVLNSIQGKRPLRPTSEEAPQLTNGVWAAIQHCWKKDPKSRPSITIVGAWLGLISKS